MSQTRHSADWRAIAALCYLAAPVLVFLGGWLKPFFAAITLVGLLYALARTCRQLRTASQPPGHAALIFLALLALAWAALGGAGHLVYANTDWHTRDTVYADLILAQWPPMYPAGGDIPVILRSAIGYYLPPALLASMLGISWAPMLLLGWTALGVFLFLMLLPLPHRLGWPLVVTGLCVAGFSGIDFIGGLLLHGHLPIFPLPLEWWSPWTYTSLTGQLFWAPNHALALWIGTALYFRCRDHAGLPALALLAMPLILVWTPFALIGLLPFITLSLVRNRKHAWQAIRGLPFIFWIGILLPTYVILRYFSLDAVGQAAHNAVAGMGPLPPDPLATASRLGVDNAMSFAVFVLCEFLLLAVVIWPAAKRWMRGEFLVAVGVLLILPLFRVGPSNDLLLRASTPSLLLLLIAVLAVVSAGNPAPIGKIRRALLVCILGVGLITPFHEVMRAITWNRWPPDFGQSLLEQQKLQMPPHYFGKLGAPDLTALMREPALVPPRAQRRVPLMQER